MSFFGLTSFGPDNFLKSKQVNVNGYTLFSNEEFKKAFLEFTKESNELMKISDLEKYLKKVYEFVPYEDEILMFKHFSQKSNQDTINLEELLSTIQIIRGMLNKYLDYLNEVAKKSKKFDSYQKYYDETYKHKRKEANPYDSFKLPVTYGQQYGFYKFKERDLNDDPKFPIIKCEETKYGEAIIQAGKNFMK